MVYNRDTHTLRKFLCILQILTIDVCMEGFNQFASIGVIYPLKSINKLLYILIVTQMSTDEVMLMTRYRTF